MFKSKEKLVSDTFGEPEPGQRYRFVQVGTITVAEEVTNYADSIGWRLHTMRDGVSVGLARADAGFTLVFERRL